MYCTPCFGSLPLAADLESFGSVKRSLSPPTGVPPGAPESAPARVASATALATAAAFSFSMRSLAALRRTAFFDSPLPAGAGVSPLGIVSSGGADASPARAAPAAASPVRDAAGLWTLIRRCRSSAVRRLFALASSPASHSRISVSTSG